MNRYFWKRSIGSLLIALASLQLTRLVFFLNLKSYFKVPAEEVVHAFLQGIQFDLVSVAFLLGPFFLAIPLVKDAALRGFFRWYYLAALAFANLVNCIDTEFFKFTARRSTDDLVEFAFLSDDLFNIAPNLLSYFWYLLAFYGLIMVVTYFLITKLLSSNSEKSTPNWFGLPITVVFLVIASRGGFNKPLSIIDAGKLQPHLSPVVLNTSFTMLKTVGKPELAEYSFPSEEKADMSPLIFPTNDSGSTNLSGQNVVIIIMESMATEYIGALNGLGHTYTPFVDSLCGRSLVFQNAFSNGHRSIEGIPAIVASIPTLMYEAFSTSKYASNEITSMANLLKRKGYYTSFMHGGNKNSMNFESFATHAGYDLVYERDDYPFPDEHYDGYWGISDHYFLNQCVDEFSSFPKPFFSSVFTLSSHHPYAFPAEYHDRFPKGNLPIHESIGYADEALRQFFRNASKTDWYKNTLFIITADHTSLSEYQQFQNKIGSIRIPIIFFHPSDSILVGKPDQIMQQTDILPTALSLLNYDQPYFALGVDALNPSVEHMAVAFKQDQFQLYRNDLLICSDGSDITLAYHVRGNELEKCDESELNSAAIKENEAYLKAYIQNYSFALNHNAMTFERWMEAER